MREVLVDVEPAQFFDVVEFGLKYTMDYKQRLLALRVHVDIVSEKRMTLCGLLLKLG